MRKDTVAKSESETNQIEVEIAKITSISPHNKALFEAGKKMLIDSVDVGRRFCQFMITLSSTLIMVYIGILKFIWNDKYAAASSISSMYIIPPVLFLFSCAIFIISYFPRTENYSLDILDEVKLAREKIISQRKKLITIGVSLFLLGMLFSIFLFAAAMGILKFP